MRELQVPPVIDAMGRAGAAFVVNTSSGKDSRASQILASRCKAQRPEWTGPIVATMAHLGRAEHAESPAQAQRDSDLTGMPLHVVRATYGDLLDIMQRNMDRLKDRNTPGWPSSAARYCTSDAKVGPINRFLRTYDLVVNIMGMGARESAARAKKQPVSVRDAITSDRYFDWKTVDGKRRKRPLSPDEAWRRWYDFPVQVDLFSGGEHQARPRLVLNWLPIHDFSEDEVWEANGTSRDELEQRRALYAVGSKPEAFAGWRCHPAYVKGYSRVSCVFCILASIADLMVGAREYPELLETYRQMEISHGFLFRKDFSIASLKETIL